MRRFEDEEVIMSRSLLCTTALCLLSWAPIFAGTTYYVNGTIGDDAYDGLAATWDGTHGPKKTIQAGIDAAADTDEVAIAPGTYTGEGNRDLDFAHGLPAGQTRAITVRSTNPDDPGVVAATVIDCERRGRGFRFHQGETEAATVAGLTIQNGVGITGSGGMGGGILCDMSSPTITKCRILGNDADGRGRGGGIGCVHSSRARIENCVIAFNTAELIGGGIGCAFQSSPTVAGCIIADNSRGGIGCDAGTVNVANCTITRNTFCGIGAEYGSITAIHCTIVGNYGEGCYSYSANPALVSCILWSNVGGSFRLYQGATPNVTFGDVEGGFQGAGNIDADPLFIGIVRSEHIYVDASNTGLADGSAEHPYPTLQQVIGQDARAQFSFRLGDGSPCIGSGQGGTNMGADNGVGGTPGPKGITLHVAPGTYSLDGCSFAEYVSLIGADVAATVLEGTVEFLRGATVLRGVTVTRGTRSGIRAGYGGSPTIEDCRVTANSASGSGGGGIYLSGSGRPIIRNCVIGNNIASWGGGIATAGGSSPEIVNCTIADNRAGGDGGGISCSGGQPTIRDCVILRNTGDGGGIYVSQGASATIVRCEITQNTTGTSGWGYGGGLFCRETKVVTIADCTIAANTAGAGGGLYSMMNEAVSLTNCTIAGNVGSGIYCREESGLAVTNCTVVANAAGSGGGINCWDQGSASVTNSIIGGNSGGSIQCTYGGACPSITYSDVEGGFPGEGNLGSDPRFVGYGTRTSIYVDAANTGPADGSREHPYPTVQDVIGAGAATTYSLRLADDSPCIGAGRNGVNLGADHGVGGIAGATATSLYVASGTYSLEGCSFANNISLIGDGATRTVLDGTVSGLRTGTRLTGVTVTKAAGAGIEVPGGETPLIEDCTIDGNAGRGIECGAGSPTIRFCTVTANRGGVGCSSGSNPSILACTIANNSGTDGAGIHCWDRSSPTIRQCRILNNSAGSYGNGGGLLCQSGCNPLLIDSLIAGNQAGRSGGAAYVFGHCSPRIVNCTLIGNRAAAGNAVFLATYDVHDISTASIAGSILCNGGNQLGADDGSIFAVSYSDVVGGWPGEGNVDADPRFVDPNGPDGDPATWQDNDYRLAWDSLCIDAGDPAFSPLPGETDIDGRARVAYGRVDMGAYEFAWHGPIDFDGDTDVDVTDFGFFQACFSGPNRPWPNVAICPQADLDGDADVDMADFLQLQACFNGANRPPRCPSRP
jgi:parallel beta-helix repeat protein